MGPGKDHEEDFVHEGAHPVKIFLQICSLFFMNSIFE